MGYLLTVCKIFVIKKICDFGSKKQFSEPTLFAPCLLLEFGMISPSPLNDDSF
jgi:hypothetical protein